MPSAPIEVHHEHVVEHVEPGVHIHPVVSRREVLSDVTHYNKKPTVMREVDENARRLRFSEIKEEHPYVIHEPAAVYAGETYVVK